MSLGPLMDGRGDLALAKRVARAGHASCAQHGIDHATGAAGFMLGYLFMQLGREATDDECQQFLAAIQPTLLLALPQTVDG